MPNSNKYYLSINGQIINFRGLEGFKNMEDFLVLSLFTGLFKDREELFSNLKHMGLISPEEELMDIYIVKRRGNSDYTFATDDILYKSSTRFLSQASIFNFLYKNRNNHEAMQTFLSAYSSRFIDLISAFEKVIETLKRELEFKNEVEKQDAASIIDKKQNSLNNFYYQYTNIVRLKQLMDTKDSSLEEKEQLENEYISRLQSFIDNEANYIRRGGKSPNKRGLVGLAINANDLAIKYEGLYLPPRTTKNDTTINELLKALRYYLEHPIKQEIKPSKKPTGKQEEEGKDEPDDYMFIENEDLKRIPSNDRSNFIALLDEKKAKPKLWKIT